MQLFSLWKFVIIITAASGKREVLVWNLQPFPSPFSPFPSRPFLVPGSPPLNAARESGYWKSTVSCQVGPGGSRPTNGFRCTPTLAVIAHLHTVWLSVLACDIPVWCFSDSGGATPGGAVSNDLAGRSTALAPPCLLLCFGNSVNRKWKCYHSWPLLFVLFWQWNNLSGVVGLHVLRATTKKGRLLFWGKKCIPVTWLEDVLTSKWPGFFAALAPPLFSEKKWQYGPRKCW